MLDEIKKLLKDRGIESFTSIDEKNLYGTHANTVIEAWHKKRKITIYFYRDYATLLRVWGPHIWNEMSEHKIESADDAISHIDWLIGG